MKKTILTILALIGLVGSPLAACPTCVGRIHEDSPPFFSEEFYKPNNESMDELYEQLIQDESQPVSKASNKPTAKKTKKEES